MDVCFFTDFILLLGRCVYWDSFSSVSEELLEDFEPMRFFTFPARYRKRILKMRKMRTPAIAIHLALFHQRRFFAAFDSVLRAPIESSRSSD